MRDGEINIRIMEHKVLIVTVIDTSTGKRYDSEPIYPSSCKNVPEKVCTARRRLINKYELKDSECQIETREVPIIWKYLKYEYFTDTYTASSIDEKIKAAIGQLKEGEILRFEEDGFLCSNEDDLREHLQTKGIV
jgi:hypothetical protein